MPKQTRNAANTDAAKKNTKKAVKKPTAKKIVKKTDAAADTAETTKRGAKSQYANKVLPYLAEIGRYIHYGVTEGDICDFYGVGKTQWADYKKKYPELTETLSRARAAQKKDLLDNAFRIAIGYEYEEEYTEEIKDKNGAIVGSKTRKQKKYAKPDAGMLQFLLINRFTAEYARDPQMVALRKKALELAEQGKIPPDGWEGV